MWHHVFECKIGNFKVVVHKPHGFSKEWYVNIWHHHTWMMTGYTCSREQLINNIRKELFKLSKEMRLKKFRMSYCR